jgi:hypothetical protein
MNSLEVIVPQQHSRLFSSEGPSDPGPYRNCPFLRAPGECAKPEKCCAATILVARGGVEPPTFRFSVGRSYQLSYLAEPPRIPETKARSSRFGLGDPDRARTGDLRRDRAAR